MIAFRLSVAAGWFRGEGFTLLELLVVVALISLLALVVPPAFFNDSTREFNKAVDSALLMLRRARLEAVMERRSSNVIFPKAPAEADLQNSWFHEGIEVKISGNDVEPQPQIAQVRFFPDGSSTGGILDFKGQLLKRRILIQPESGRIQIEQEQ
ncbi:MAG: prepilin-type N-terminal cleavage/methylation domain-containing protein [Gammaproteobacteria bacterium]|nr:prepilin-type N-terminal cleavage/methylation domain-containing protein [Gammaproteobacteria bacterium]